MAKKIVVLSDGTWETVTTGTNVLVVTDDAYDRLCEGDRICDLAESDVVDEWEVK